MLRYDQSPASNSIDFEFSVDEKVGRSPMNTSANSAISAVGLGSTASSSKAVLAALRALQDKIRRLEVEKTQALDDAAQLRSQLKAQEIETDHAKERDTLHQQKSLQEARIRYETVLAEKTDMEAKIYQLQQHNHNIEQELESVKAKNRTLEATHTSSADKLADLEDQITHLEKELQGSRQKEKGMKRMHGFVLSKSLICFAC
jgi:chromosome segregation ATPase